MTIIEFCKEEMKVANKQMYKDICDKTNKDYDQKIVGQFGWDNFLLRVNEVRGTDYAKWPPPGNGQITIDLLKLFITIKAKFVDRKSLAAYGKDAVTFNVYPNTEEPFINAFKYVKEYFDLLDKLPCHSYNDADYVFPNMTPKIFQIGPKGSTKYFRDILGYK